MCGLFHTNQKDTSTADKEHMHTHTNLAMYWFFIFGVGGWDLLYWIRIKCQISFPPECFRFTRCLLFPAQRLLRYTFLAAEEVSFLRSHYLRLQKVRALPEEPIYAQELFLNKHRSSLTSCQFDTFQQETEGKILSSTTVLPPLLRWLEAREKALDSKGRRSPSMQSLSVSWCLHFYHGITRIK